MTGTDRSNNVALTDVAVSDSFDPDLAASDLSNINEGEIKNADNEGEIKNAENVSYYHDAEYADYLSKRESENWLLDHTEDYAVAVTTKLFGSKITSSIIYEDTFVWKAEHLNCILLKAGYEPISKQSALGIHRMIVDESTTEIELMSVAANEKPQSVQVPEESKFQHIFLSVCATYQQRPQPY